MTMLVSFPELLWFLCVVPMDPPTPDTPQLLAQSSPPAHLNKKESKPKENTIPCRYDADSLQGWSPERNQLTLHQEAIQDLE